MRARRITPVVAGLTIVLVPTLFAVFPEWARWSWILRALVLLVWVLAAAVVVYQGTRQSERIEDLLRPGRRRRDAARKSGRSAAPKGLACSRSGWFSTPLRVSGLLAKRCGRSPPTRVRVTGKLNFGRMGPWERSGGRCV
jgi:hypothetical protein